MELGVLSGVLGAVGGRVAVGVGVGVTTVKSGSASSDSALTP